VFCWRDVALAARDARIHPPARPASRPDLAGHPRVLSSPAGPRGSTRRCRRCPRRTRS
jgi:hypothetical protein